jgi:hypothetical protein
MTSNNWMKVARLAASALASGARDPDAAAAVIILKQFLRDMP